MATLGDMIEEVKAHLRAYTRDQEMSTHLTETITSSASTIPVNDASIVSRGRIEIDDEVIWVDSVDRVNKTLTIPPYGRGMESTAALSHSAGTRVIVTPLYPRQMVRDIVNAIISSVSGTLYGVQTEQFDVNSLAYVYELPETARKVVSVTVEYDSTVLQDTEHVRRWKFDPNAQYTVAGTGKALYVYEGLRPQGPIPFGLTSLGKLNVTYLVDPQPLTSTGDDFSETLLPESCRDVIVLGAAARLMSVSAAGSLATRSVESGALDGRVDGSAALQQARYLQTLFQQRLMEEQMKLFDTYSNRTHYTG